MIRLIVFLVIAGLLAFGAIYLANSSGAVVLRWDGVDRSLRLDYAAAILLAIVAAGIVLYEIWRNVFSLPKKIREMHRNSREVRGHRALSSGLIAAAAGDVAAAREHARQAEKLLDDNPSTLLLSAQTAQLEDKNDVAQIKFRQMLRQPDTEFLGLRGLLADAMRQGDREEALSLARRAYRRNPSTPWVLTTLFDLLTREEQWSEALKITNDLARQKLIDKKAATRRRALLTHMMARQAQAKDNPELALKHARRATELGGGFAPAAVTAAEVAMKLKRLRAGRDAIERVWRISTHPSLAKAYAGLVPNETAAARLKRFQRLRDLNPNDVVTQLSLAELAMNAKDWAAARSHLDRALEINPTAGGYRLYAEFLRASGGDEAKAFEMTNRAADAPLDSAWVCDDTGEILPEWSLFGSTGRFDSVHWQVPPTVAHLAIPSSPVGVLDHIATDAGQATQATVVEPASASTRASSSAAA